MNINDISNDNQQNTTDNSPQKPIFQYLHHKIVSLEKENHELKKDTLQNSSKYNLNI